MRGQEWEGEGWEEGEKGREEGEGEGKREGVERGKKCARVAPRREEGDKGREGEGEAYPPPPLSTPSPMRSSHNYITAISSIVTLSDSSVKVSSLAQILYYGTVDRSTQGCGS